MLSPQAIRLLRQLHAMGIYGWTIEDVAARMIDERLREFIARN